MSKKLQPMASVNYLGCIERIANEVYTLEIQNGKYTVSLTVDTFHKNAARLTVDIIPEYQIDDMGKRIDVYLEKLKIELKNRIITDWSSCTWLIDEQSEQMCAELYGSIQSYGSAITYDELYINFDGIQLCPADLVSKDCGMVYWKQPCNDYF